MARFPIPADRQRLLPLIEVCERCIATVSERRQIRLAQYEVLCREPKSDHDRAEWERVLSDLRKGELKSRARLPIEALLPYLTEDFEPNLLVNSERKDEKFARLSRYEGTERVAYLNRGIMLGSLIQIDESILKHLRELHVKLLDSLDKAGRGFSKLPSNTQVIELHKRLALNGGRRSNREIAMELVDGDKTRAESLLRQERRYRDMLAR